MASIGAPLATPSNPAASGVFSISAAATLPCRPLTALLTVLNTASYPSWNRFVPLVTLVTPVPALSPALPPAVAQVLAAAADQEYVRPEARMTFHVAMRHGWPHSKTALRVVSVDAYERDGREGWRVVWAHEGTPAMVLRSERVQEFLAVVDADGHVTETEFRTWETFAGVMAYGIRAMLSADLINGFNNWGEDLKKETGRREKESKTADNK